MKGFYLKLPNLPKLPKISLRIKTGNFIAIGLACLILVTMPASWLNALALGPFVENQRVVLGFCFIICATCLVARFLNKLFESGNGKNNSGFEIQKPI